MNSFTRFLFPENILLDLEASDVADVFAHIATLMERQHQIDRALVFEGLCTREQWGSTALGEGWAIPHAQIAALSRPMTLFVRVTRPVSFGSSDEKKLVSGMFVLLVPRDGIQEHLQMLAEVAEMLCDPVFRERLANSRDVREIQYLCQRWPEEAWP